MIFSKESDFEDALVNLLFKKGWSPDVIMYPTADDLLKNWADILYKNNSSIDRLGDYPLTDSEMQQLIEQINSLRTPLKLNSFINGKSVTIRRDNENDKLHFGKEVSLKLFDRTEIAGGDSCYQIARQPKFVTKSPLQNNRRGDIMLLINGMPVIHVELKRTGVPVSDAYRQIEKYSHEGVFTGIFSLVQIFVAMTPDETRYFANPGEDGKFNPDFYFHWADFNNEPINDWAQIADRLISIPMAHQMIGFYTVADSGDGCLKVLRSYQYYAASAISDKVAKNHWGEGKQLGGYIWHTTGSGKTMTSFKSAQLIANSRDADKVVFLTDRVELGTQSLIEYRDFADDSDTVNETEDTHSLIAKLKSSSPDETLIVTSIQKMSRIKEEGNMNAHDIALINQKRIVFIIDEAHRSTFGEMIFTIKSTFPDALFFGFTGTPIHEENQKKMNTTASVFGDELHRYSIADGIRDKNVLGFDPYRVSTFKDSEIREKVALEQAKAVSVKEAMADETKKSVFLHYYHDVPMAGYTGTDGRYIKGIEDFLPDSQYKGEKSVHRELVVKDIIDNWTILSVDGKFHAILATSSIPEAIEYYRLLKKSSIKVTCLFDSSIDNDDSSYYRIYHDQPIALFKEDGLVEIIDDYSKQYGQKYSMATYAAFKKDVSLRLAHKRPYERIERTPDQQIDLLIVVDQMLTGFDSKWLNTLYIDKVLRYEKIIQAFSRTNRLFGHEKRFGTIKYYRRPYTMEKYIEEAVKLYSGDKPLGKH